MALSGLLGQEKNHHMLTIYVMIELLAITQHDPSIRLPTHHVTVHVYLYVVITSEYGWVT